MERESGFKDTRQLTRWVQYFLYAQVLIAGISIFSNFLEHQLLSDFQNKLYSSQELAVADAEKNDQRQQYIGFIFLAIHLASGFLILRWIHRANYNARQLGAEDLTFTPGWSIGYFFVPVLSLWKPYQAMKEIWKATHNPSNWQDVKTDSVLGYWWFFWIVSNILNNAVLRMSLRSEELPELLVLNIVTQISLCVDILLALVTLSLINSLARAQKCASDVKQGTDEIRPLDTFELDIEEVSEQLSPEDYAAELNLFEAGDLDQSLWAKYLVEADGDAEKAKWQYIKARVKTQPVREAEQREAERKATEEREAILDPIRQARVKKYEEHAQAGLAVKPKGAGCFWVLLALLATGLLLNIIS